MERSNRKLKIIIILLILALLCGGVVFFIRQAIGGAASKLSLQSSSCGYVKYRDLFKYVSMSGTVASSDTIGITGEPDLKVSKLNVKVGDTVKEGDILCEFDSSQLMEQYETLKESNEKAQGASEHSHSINERNLEEAKKAKEDTVKKAQEAIDNAISKRDKAFEEYNALVEEYAALVEEETLLEKNAAASPENAEEIEAKLIDVRKKGEITSKAADELHAQLSSFEEAIVTATAAYKDAVRIADADIRSAQDILDSEKYTPADTNTDAQLKELKEKIDRCIVKAPKDGVVTKLNISIGSVPASSNIMIIENASQLVISGKVNEADILRINEGMKADVKASATGDRVISGRVKRIERIVSSESGSAADGYTVEIAIDEENSGLLIGMSASAKIILDKRLNTLSIPYDSVIGGDNDGYFVFVATSTSDGKYIISKRKIDKGFDGDYYLEVTSGNLNQNDIVLTSPRGISDGDIITLTLPEE